MLKMSKQFDLYLSGPMTGYPNKNFDTFNKAVKLLRSKGYTVLNPQDLEVQEPKDTWENCIRRDIRELLKCKAIATLPNWRYSKGASLEVYIGRNLSLKVAPVSYYLKRSK